MPKRLSTTFGLSLRFILIDYMWHGCLADERPNLQQMVTERLERSRRCTRIPLISEVPQTGYYQKHDHL
jgi:hypothetical protein